MLWFPLNAADRLSFEIACCCSSTQVMILRIKVSERKSKEWNSWERCLRRSAQKISCVGGKKMCLLHCVITLTSEGVFPLIDQRSIYLGSTGGTFRCKDVTFPREHFKSTVGGEENWVDISLWWLNNHRQQPQQRPQTGRRDADHIKLLNPGQRWLTESVYWWRDNKSVYQSHHSEAWQRIKACRQWNHTQPQQTQAIAQLHLDISPHVCHSRRACLTPPPSNLTDCLSFSLPTDTQLAASLLLTSTKELQVADLFSDLQLEDLLEDLLPQRLLDDAHPLQLLPVQTQQCPSCQEEGRWSRYIPNISASS